MTGCLLCVYVSYVRLRTCLRYTTAYIYTHGIMSLSALLLNV